MFYNNISDYLLFKNLTKALSVLLAISAFFWSIFYPDYSKNSEKVLSLPWLDEEYVPQGSTYLKDENIYISCGYMEDGTSSRLYMKGEDTEKRIILQRADGSEYAGHAGGVTAAGDYVYVSNAEKIFVLSKDALLSAADGDTVNFIGDVPVPCRSSFCSCDGEYLYVGEYHADGYETDESHIMKTPDGTEYQALVFAYPINPESEFGFDSSPAKAFSICDEVQGFAVTPDSRAVLSCSASLHNSKLKIYDISGEADGTFTQDGAEIPLYCLDSGRFSKQMTLPRMSEDAECVDGRILLSFEAGAKKFYPELIPFAVKKMVLVTV